MLNKMIVGSFIGLILTGILFMGLSSPTFMTAQSEDSTPTEVMAENAESYREVIISSLQKAGAEIQDNDIDQFYQELLQEYELDELSSGEAQAEYTSLAEMLPDIKKVNHAAVTLPLQKAGKNIQDKEIAQFYYKFLKDVGWTIEPD